MLNGRVAASLLSLCSAETEFPAGVHILVRSLTRKKQRKLFHQNTPEDMPAVSGGKLAQLLLLGLA